MTREILQTVGFVLLMGWAGYVTIWLIQVENRLRKLEERKP